MTTLFRSVLIGALGLAAALLVACGESNGLLPSSQGDALGSKLDAVSAAVSSGKCSEARSASAKLTAEVASLPPTVNPKLRRALSDGSRTVQRQAKSDCHAPAPAAPSAPSTTPTSSPPSTPAPTTSPSTPAPTTPRTTPSTPSHTKPHSTPKPSPSTPTPPPKTQAPPGNGGAGAGNSSGGGASEPGKGK